MGDDLRVANVARVSFNKWKEEFDKSDARLIDYLASHEHSSPFRHTAVSIRCKVPVFLARQLGKHQAGLSWNEVSRRYVDSGIEFYVPDSWRSRPTGDMKQGSGVDVVTELDYELSKVDGTTIKQPVEYCYAHVLGTCMDVYNRMIESGVAPEMARMVLPQSMMVDFIWTGNLLSFFHVFRLRSGEGSQVEAFDFALQLERVIQPLFPVCWEALKNE
jgi:thymidylate synthase (FAD)